jgi:probable H4MPT-linked C1 transfer pathway protein
MPPAEGLAVTMTGELCDCFAGKGEGVHAILDAVEGATRGRAVRVFATTGDFVDVAAARAAPLHVAAGNWLALATFAGRFARTGAALVIDVGSTTTDVVGLHDGTPVPQGRSDPERLRSGELVYTGVRRTPLCALLPRGRTAAELFATTLDAYLILGRIAEDSSDRGTADGRPATRWAAHARVARMLCADLETSSGEQRYDLAARAEAKQMRLVGRAVEDVVRRLPGPPAAYLLAGEGEFLAERVVRRRGGACRVLSLAKQLGPAISRAACAYAVAVLAAQAC